MRAFTSEINDARNGVIVACASARRSMKRQHHEGDTCVPAWVHRRCMQKHGDDKIKSRVRTPVRDWQVGFVTGTREIKARAHNEVPARVQGSWRTTVEPNVCTRRDTYAVVLPNAVLFSYVIFIIFRMLYTPSRYFQHLLFTQSRRQYFCVNWRFQWIVWMFFTVTRGFWNYDNIFLFTITKSSWK